MLFYAFKIAMTIAFFWEYAAEAIKFKIIDIEQFLILSTTFFKINKISPAVLNA